MHGTYTPLFVRRQSSVISLHNDLLSRTNDNYFVCC